MEISGVEQKVQELLNQAELGMAYIFLWNYLQSNPAADLGHILSELQDVLEQQQLEDLNLDSEGMIMDLGQQLQDLPGIFGFAHIQESLLQFFDYTTDIPNFAIKSMLIHALPGMGKTALVKSMAVSAGYSIISSETLMMNRFANSVEELMRKMFITAQHNKPALILLDDMGYICRQNGPEHETRIINALSKQIAQISQDNSGIRVVALFNDDPSIHSDRLFSLFPIQIKLPFLTQQNMAEMLISQLGSTEHFMSHDEIYDAAGDLNGYTGADIASVARDALFAPIRKVQRTRIYKKIVIDDQEWYTIPSSNDTENLVEFQDFMQIPRNSLKLPAVTIDDLRNAIQQSRPSLSQAEIQQYEQLVI